jgi:hypothetical protein
VRRTRCRVRTVGIITAVAFSLGAGQGVLAQSSSDQGNGSKKNVGARQAMAAQGGAPWKGPGIKGKMNSTTSADRWAAAIRRSDVRAGKIRNDFGKGKGTP